MNLMMDTPIGATLTYRPQGAFLPKDLEFRWATPDDIVFVLAAFLGRRSRNDVSRTVLMKALEEAEESQMAWHADRMRLALVQGLGWWAKVTPSWLIDRMVALTMRHYHESTAQWSLEMANLYSQVDRLTRLVDSVKAARESRVLCQSEDCSEGFQLKSGTLRHLVPFGWRVGPNGRPSCPAHVSDFMTSKEAS